MYKEKIKEEINKALNENTKAFALERPKTKDHGDVATNIAMILSKELKKNPLDIANEIVGKIKLDERLISKIEVAKPGFINITVGNDLLSESISEVHKLGDLFGFDKPKSKEKILLEYVSANPTGDLHIGHGRQAVIGSCLANLFEAAGYDVKREFYVNDYGEQISKLSESTWALYEKLQGKEVEWKEDYYPEELLISYVKEAISSNGSNPSKESLGQKVKETILKAQRNLLASFNVVFDEWFSETSLHKSNAAKETLEKLKKSGFTYEKEGALWFKAEEFGDVRDRVLVRADGRPTYIAADIAYHENKLNRGFDQLINLWGADHHGQEVGLKGALKSIGLDEKKLELIFVQMVSLKKDGQEVKMSKRTGMVVTVAEVLEEVGSDAFRYFLIESHPNNRMVFDIDLAKKQDKDNPVYYIQYAHARCCSIFRQIKEQLPNLNIDDLEKNLSSKETFLSLFKVEEAELKATKNLILKILDFPDEVSTAAILRSPSKIANYLKELAADFHQFYTVCRVISKDESLTKARLGLIKATKITIANGLKILGVSAPESM
jgi:arginyl-tRNA synthetase